MSEIKFRAYDSEKNCFYYFSFEDIINEFGEGSAYYVPERNNGLDNIHDGRCVDITDMPKTQFTSLKDKNGKEIYGGDIVEVTDGDDWVIGKQEIKIDFELGTIDSRCIGRILGNKFQNPELLEGKQ